MDTYLLTLFVSVEQELAIRELFVYKDWDFRKQEDTSFTNYDYNKEEQYTGAIITDETVENKGNDDVDYIPSIPENVPTLPSENQMFSDLQDFVKATLEANNEQREDSIRVENSTANDGLDNRNEEADRAVEEYRHIETEAVRQTSNEPSVCLKRKVSTRRKKIGKDICKNNNVNSMKEEKQSKSLKINDEDFTNLNKLKRKQKRGLFKCKECKCIFKLKGAFKNHKKHGKCLFECEHCGKQFTSRYYCNYLVHLKYHSNERPHKCEVCDKSYIEAHTLKIHMRKHSGYRPYVCDLCGKSFYISSQLVNHKNSTHKESTEIHKCNICGHILSTLSNLRVHKKLVHSIDRPFTCEICGKTFKTQKALEQVHAKVHQEVYPFKCDIPGCDKTFKRAEGLTDHKRRHRNERTHFCDQCGKGFYSNKDLSLHARTHTGEKPFKCDLCGYKCALAGNLKKHMKTHQA